ncbi:MAG: response regulator transcription factor [Clostridia bacterium]|nr:response regulator transcription factor [Clostridia bacterium]MBR2288475.1 response regulator transcription factor [Clostridia bacterium]
MANKRILLVDDEPLIVKGLKYSLEQDNYDIDVAVDGEEAIEKFFSSPCDLILLDIMLPKLDGLAVCQRIREHSNVPIIMLTAKGEDIDKILGLEYGADDYIPKPFNILEVKARIKALFRRVGMSPIYINTRNDFVVKDLVISPVKRTVTLRGEEIKLSTKELDLLLLFAANPGKIFSRQAILQQIWTNEFTGDDRSVDVLIKRMREKIEDDTAHPFYILTKWGVGYYFTEQT